MPQILRYPFDTLTVTVDASNARYPTAVILPPRGTRGDEAESVLIAPTTNVGRYSWDAAEGADATVAATFPVSAGAALSIPIPPTNRASLKRHAMTLSVGTALADGETLTITDGTNTIVLESDATNNGVAVGSTEIGTNAATAATQATGIAAAINAGTIDIRAEVDAESTSGVILLAETSSATISITSSGTTTTSGDSTTHDVGTGVFTVTDYGRERPILYVLSATTSTAISIATVGG